MVQVTLATPRRPSGHTVAPRALRQNSAAYAEGVTTVTGANRSPSWAAPTAAASAATTGSASPASGPPASETGAIVIAACYDAAVSALRGSWTVTSRLRAQLS